MRHFQKLGILLVIIGFALTSLPGFAFNLNKLLGGKLPGMPGVQSNQGTPGIGSGQSSPRASNNADDSKEVSSGILDFMCGGLTNPKEFMHDASEETLKSLASLVAKDFGMSIEDTQNILNTEYGNDGGPGWAHGLAFYEPSFIGEELKLLFNSFMKNSLKRIEIAGKIRYAIALDDDDPLQKLEDLSDEDHMDARFAYALILAHFNNFHKSQALGERLLKESYELDSQGGTYVWGRRMYRGEGVPKDVNFAANVISGATQIEEEDNVWEENSNLWNVIAVDPAFEHHQRYQNMARDAARWKDKVHRDMARKSGSAGLHILLKMEKLNFSAQEKLSGAFGFADEYAQKAEKYKSLLDQADPNQQSVEKLVSVSGELHQYVIEQIGQTNTELDPAGKKLAREARLDITRMAHLSQAYIMQIAVSGVRGMADISRLSTITKTLSNSVNNACGLYNAFDGYMKRKEIELPDDKIAISKKESEI
ncbi:MAG: hypothetical protein VYA17_10290 [Pseudomonadota bacterium]|nr:hypothetical protein [Pseudomonadota bacterium]